MSYFNFEGYLTPSKVEVAITEPNLHIPLIFLMFQKSVYQLVSDLDQLTALTLYILILLHYIQNSRFNLFTVLSDTSVSLATFRIG